MSFTITPLPSPWNDYLRHIDYSCSAFWEQRNWPPDSIRLQSMEIWRELRRVIERISSQLIPQTEMLTPAELFLLYAAADFYEAGWQTSYALRLPVKKRYVESGCLMRNSTMPGAKLELSYLETTTLNALACISSAPGLDDLSILPLSPEPVGQEETASLRYLSALFQLADLLFIHRTNKRTMSRLIDPEMLDPSNARLLLQPYLPFVYIQPDGVTASFELHPDDEHLATKMNALFADPIRLWWERNAIWLQERFLFSFVLQAPRINIVQNAIAPDPLSVTCKALALFLEQYTPLPLISREDNSTSFSPTRSTLEERKPTTSQGTKIIAEHAHAKRTKAFISYSSKDKKYLEELHIHLKPYNIDVWDATHIPVGAKWREEIDRALDTTKVAIMLISAEFLASDFIVRNELPPLLTAAEQEGATIVSVIIGHCSFQRSPLAQFKAVNSPDKPLNLMRKRGERDIVWNQVAEIVKDALTALP